MRYYLEYNENKEVVGWLVKNTETNNKNMVEVEPTIYKSELAKIGIEFVLESEKVENLENETMLTSETVVDFDFRLTMFELGL